MDDDLRELERQRALGDPGAAAELLRRRVRAGEVAPESVRLLAQLGDPQASALYPEEASEALEHTYVGLLARDPLLGLRALCAGVRAGISRFEQWLPSDEAVSMALGAAEAYLEAPGEAAVSLAAEWAPRARESVNLVNLHLLDRYRIGQLSGSELRALEYMAWTARDAAEGVVRLSVGELPSGDSLVRLASLWSESGWGDLRRPLRQALQPGLLDRAEAGPSED